MLHSIGWERFSQTMLLLSVGYYMVIGLLYYRREIRQFLQRR